MSYFGSWVGLTKFGTKYEEKAVADITEVENISSMSYMYKGEQIHLGIKIKYNNKDYFKDIFYPGAGVKNAARCKPALLS